MYQIYVRNYDGERYILHDSRSSNIRVISPRCNLELNKTGSLTFKINPNHPNFDKIIKHQSEIYLTQDGECLFCGRILNDEADIYNFKQIECEGMLSYLLDSIQRAKLYSLTSSTKLRDYLESVIEIHNDQINTTKQFTVGSVAEEIDQLETVEFASNYKDTLTTINECLLNKYPRTYLICYLENNLKKIDFINSDRMKTNNQVIRFGTNLLNFSRTVKGEEIATAIIPLGVTVDSNISEAGTQADTKLDISELPDGLIAGSEYVENGQTYGIYKYSDYIYDSGSVAKYGLIFKPMNWSEVDDVNVLKANAIEQLNYYTKFASNIELNAFDLHLLDVNIDSIKIGEKIRVYSKLHNLDDYMIVQKMSIDLESPDKTTITLGNEERKSIDSNKSISDKTSNITSVADELTNLDYVSGSEVPNYIDSYFDSSYGNGGNADLSKYATRSEVQAAFDSLANELEGL